MLGYELLRRCSRGELFGALGVLSARMPGVFSL